MRGRRFFAWRGSFRALGGAAGELLQAELAALGDDLARSGRRLGGALLLLAGALFALFWTLGLILYLAVEVAHLWLPRWGAVAAVLGALVILLSALAGIGWRRLRRLESPAETVRRRWLSHRRWWERQFPELADGAVESAGGAAPADSGKPSAE